MNLASVFRTPEGLAPPLAAGLLRGFVPLALGAFLGWISFTNPSAAILAGIAVCVALTVLYPILGIAMLILTAPIYLVISPYIPRGLPFSFLVLVLSVVGVVLRQVFQAREPRFSWHATDKAAAFLLVNGLIYIPLAPNWKVGVYGYHEVFRLFLIYFVVRLMAPRMESVRILLWTVGLESFIILAYAIYQYDHGYELVMQKYGLVESLREYAGYQRSGVRRAYSIVGSPLTVGIMGMVAVLGGIALIAGARRRDAALWSAPFLIAAGMGASALSYTRSSWTGLAAGLFAAVLIVGRGTLRSVLVLSPFVGGLALFRLFPDLLQTLGRHALTILSLNPVETSFHYVAVEQAARFFWDHPFGVGMGTSGFAAARFGSGAVIWTENNYFHVAVQTGLQGLIALLIFLGTAVNTGLKLYRDKNSNSLSGRLGCAVVLGMAGFSITGISNPVLMDISAMGPLFFALALAENLAQKNRRGLPSLT